MDVRTALGRFASGVDLPPGLVEEMQRVASKVRLARGTVFCRAGDPCKGVGLLEKGSIRVFKTGPTGREITLYHVTPGQTCLLTLNGALTGEAYSADALVEEDVEAAVLPVESFREWVDRDPAFRRFIFHSIAVRLSDLMALFDEVAFGRLDRRLAEFLLTSSNNRRLTEDVVHMTHDQIASELGSAREVISRLLKDLERQGILSLGRGKLEIRNRDLLEEIVQRK